MQSSERSMRSSRKLVADPTPSPGPEEQSDGGQFMCIECGETFDTRLELNSHRQSHVTKRQFTCARCGRGFHHQVFLQMHERSHEDGGPGVKTPPVRVISTRSTKMAEVAQVRPAYPKPQRLLNSIVTFKNEQNVCRAFAPKECVTRLSHGAAPPPGQKRDGLEKKSSFELRISKLSDATVHLMDSFGNSIEILADVFNTYTIGEEENGAMANEALAAGNSPSGSSSDETSSKSFTGKLSVSADESPPPAGGTDVGLPPSHEPVTGEGTTSQILDPGDAGPSEPTTSNLMSVAAPEQKPMESQPSSQAVPDQEGSSVSHHHSPAVDSGNLHAEDHMGTSAAPTFPQQVPNEASPKIDQKAERGSAADEPVGGTDSRLEGKPSTVELPSEDRSLLDGQGSSADAACSAPKTNEDGQQSEGDAGAEQNPDLTLLKPDAETGPERRDLSSAPSDNVSAGSLPLESRVHEQPNKDHVNPSPTLSTSRDGVSLPPENTPTGRRSAQELESPDIEMTCTPPAPEEHSGRTDVHMARPEKHDLQPAPVEENAGKNLEADICVSAQEAGEGSISEGEVCSPGQEDHKEPEKPCSLLAEPDILHDGELVIDDKRDDDLFERDIFPLGAPMEQSMVCSGEAHGTKIARQKESDICLNDRDMTYISESEMIKLLEQDKDDLADDEPVMSSQKENEGLSHKDGASSEPKLGPELSSNAKEVGSCPSPASENTAEVKNYQVKPALQAIIKEKMDTDACLPLCLLTNDEPRTGDAEPQDATKSVLTQDSLPKKSSNEQLGFAGTSSSSPFQPLTKEGSPDLPQAGQGLPRGDQRNASSPGLQDVHPVEASALPSSELATEEDNDVFVTVEDEFDDGQMEPSDSPLLEDAAVESGSGKPHTTTPVCKGQVPAIETKTIECVGDNLPGQDRETQKTVCSHERISTGSPPQGDYVQSTSEDNGDHSADKNEGKQVDQDGVFLLKNNDGKGEEKTTDLSSDLDGSSKTLSTTENAESKKNDPGKLPTAKTDLGGLEGNSVTKDLVDLEEPSVAPSKGISEESKVVEDDDQPVCQLRSVPDVLDDSELIESKPQDKADDVDTPSKPLGVGGECLKCGRKLRRGRKEMVWLPVCFKCRKAAKRLERLSSQEVADGLDVSVAPVKSRRPGGSSYSRVRQAKGALLKDISGGSSASLDPLLALDEKAALTTAAKKRYKCPKCDEAFRIPALLAGHIKCHTLPQCLSCGCQMKLKYKTKRIPRRCQKCVQQLKEKRAEKKLGEGSGEEYSDNEDAVSVADINPDDVSDEDSHVAVQKAKRRPLKAAKPGPRHPRRHIADDVLSLNESPAGKHLDDEEMSSFRKAKTQELDSSDELDAGDQNIRLLDGDKPRLCPQCDKAFPCNRSLHLHLLSHSAVQCDSCGCRLPKKRRVGRWSKKCRSCRLQLKDTLLTDSGDEMSEKLPKQKNVASVRLKAKQSKSAKIQSIIKKKKELKWMNMLLAVKGLMDKSRKKKENALKAADLARKEGESSEAEKCDAVEDAGLQPDQAFSDPHHPDLQKAGPSELPCPPDQAPSNAPKQGRKCLYKEKNIIKVEENEGLPYNPASDGSNSSPFIKQEEMWQCLECNQSWPNCDALINHQHSHTGGQSFPCAQCPQVFSSEEFLNIHIHAHDEERPFRCPECDKTFTKRNHLGVHMRVHSGCRPFVCPDCPCRFRQKVTLIAHRYSHRNYQLMFAKPFQCSVCSKSFKQKERLVVHERLHTGECPFSCKDCDKVFPSKARLYVHRKMHKICEAAPDGEQSLSSNEVLEGQPFKCQDCGKICSTKASFVLHRKVHKLSAMPVQSIKREENEEEPAFTCKDCNKVFSSKGSLSMHLKNHSAHKASAKSEMSPDLKEGFPCKLCGKVCSTKASLALHRKVHKSPPAGEQNLLIKVESDSPSYVCKDCDKVCSTKASLVLHRKVHKTEMGAETEPPTFRCKDCDVVCSTKATFVSHRKMHRKSTSCQRSPKANAEAKSYTCKHCDMVCSTKASFALHSKVHKSLSIGEEDLKADPEPQLYNCKHCEMVCSTKASFALHSKVHRALADEQSPKAAAKPQLYNCKYCEMVCSTKASFVLHSKVHRSLFGDEESPKTPEEPRSYNCKHCDTVCSTKASFALHNKVHRLSSGAAQSPKAAEELMSYSCKECDMVCSTKASFVLHSKVHKSGQNPPADAVQKSFTCKACNKACPTKTSLILHRKTHKSSSSEPNLNPKGDGEEPFQCKDCGKIFSSKGRLSAHSKVHEDGRDQSADPDSNAEQPKKTNEEKPFPCTVCGLRFAKLRMLVRHKAVHGERTVTPCIHCGKQFLYMKSLFNHIKICQSKGKKLRLKKAAAKRKIPKDGGSAGSDGESAQKKRKADEKPKALTAAQKLKNKTVKAKKNVLSKERGKGKSALKAKEKRAGGDGEAASEGDGKKTAAEKPNDAKQEEPAAKDPTPKKSAAKAKKAKREPAKVKPQKVGGAKKWRVLAASTVKKKNLKAVLIGGKKKLLLKKKVPLKARAGGKAGKD